MSPDYVLDVVQPAVGMAVIVFMLVVVLVVMIVVMIVVMPGNCLRGVRVGMFMIVIVFMLMRVFMRMRVLVIVHVLRFLLLAVHLHAYVGAGDAALDGGLADELDPGDAQGIELGYKGVGIRHELKKSGGQHVAGSAHAAVYVESLHSKSSFPVPPVLASIWLILLARNPAPKPLSMLTTDTPAAQELSMDSSADTPPNDAP